MNVYVCGEGEGGLVCVWGGRGGVSVCVGRGGGVSVCVWGRGGYLGGRFLLSLQQSQLLW